MILRFNSLSDFVFPQFAVPVSLAGAAFLGRSPVLSDVLLTQLLCRLLQRCTCLCHPFFNRNCRVVGC